jgi:hypothetical protein
LGGLLDMGLMIAICSSILALYLFRFCVTEFLDKSGVHPRKFSRLVSTLDDVRELDDRESLLSFGRSALKEKSLMLGNVFELATYRRHMAAEAKSPEPSDRFNDRVAEYSSHLRQLDEEIAEAIMVEQKARDLVGVERSANADDDFPSMWDRLSRYLQAALVILLAVWIVFLIFVG